MKLNKDLEAKVKGKKVLIAVSGGVDSTTASVMLHKMGASVISMSVYYN